MNMDHIYFKALPSCTQNSYLVGSMISQHVVRSWINCLSVCVLTETCRSVNMWENPAYKRNVTCQLNWSIGINCSDLQSAPDVRYMMVDYASCTSVKRAVPDAPDGEYTLWFGKRSARVYCHNMDTSEPLVSIIKGLSLLSLVSIIKVYCHW